MAVAGDRAAGFIAKVSGPDKVIDGTQPAPVKIGKMSA